MTAPDQQRCGNVNSAGASLLAIRHGTVTPLGNQRIHVGGPPGRSHATFRIGATNYAEPPGLIPDAGAITAKLGLQPSESHDAGELTRSKSARAAPYRHGVWLLKSPLPRVTELEAHVLWLVDQLLPVRSRLMAVLESDPKTLEHIAALRTSLWFDLYCMDDDDSTTETLPVDRTATESSPARRGASPGAGQQERRA